MWSPACTTESIATSLINHSSWELHVSTTMPSMPAKKTKTKNKILDDRYYGSTAHDQFPGSILNYYRPVPWVNAQQVRRPSHSSGFTRRQSNTGHLIATRLANVVAMALNEEVTNCPLRFARYRGTNPSTGYLWSP